MALSAVSRDLSFRLLQAGVYSRPWPRPFAAGFQEARPDCNSVRVLSTNCKPI